jgi:hypothetical protein
MTNSQRRRDSSAMRSDGKASAIGMRGSAMPTRRHGYTAMLGLVGNDTKDRKAYQDIFWGLLNSTEFLFNH